MGPSLRLRSHRNKVKTDFSLNDKSTTDDNMFALILSTDCILTFKCPIGNIFPLSMRLLWNDIIAKPLVLQTEEVD